MKEEEAVTDIEEVKAEIQDVAVEGHARGGGGGCGQPRCGTWATLP